MDGEGLMIEDGAVPGGLALDIALADEARGLLVDLTRYALCRHNEGRRGALHPNEGTKRGGEGTVSGLTVTLTGG